MNEIHKKQIDVVEYASEIIAGVKKGALITTKAEDRVNTMSIAWGQLGIEWNRVIFTAFVRTSRFTHEMLDNSDCFTINIGKGDKAAAIISYCGTKSGRDTDKIADLNLTLVDGNTVNVPGIAEMPLTLECKVIYRQLQEKDVIPDYIKQRFYPEKVDSSVSSSNKDFHTVFFGEVTNAYIIEK